MTDEGEEADRLWAAIADPTRQQLLDRILAAGDATATALARDLPITRQGIAKHLAVLDVRSDSPSTKTASTKPLDKWHRSSPTGTSASPRSNASPRPSATLKTDPAGPRHGLASLRPDD